MLEITRDKHIDIIFQNSLGEINRVTASSDREAQEIIKERQSIGEIPIASAVGNEGINLTEKYRIQESSDPFSIKR